MLSASELVRIALAFVTASLLAVRGHRSGALDLAGAVAAFFVGFLSLSASYRFGSTLIIFYLTSTKATRFRAALKARVEDGHGGPRGNRGAAQVLGSSGPAVLVALIHLYRYRYDGPISSLRFEQSALNLFVMLFFAACSGDTFASELGTVLGSAAEKPVLVYAPGTVVPRGTNGGVTFAGTIASAVGGLIIGTCYYLLGPNLGSDQLALLPVGLLGGAVGSVLDSLIGSVWQISMLDITTGKVLKNSPPIEEYNFREVRHICGRDLLSGEAVNCLAAVLTAAFAPLAVRFFF
jgi:uncharacterized protein (TIGR00297 family)